MDSPLDHLMLQETYKRIGLALYADWSLTSPPLTVVLKNLGHWLGSLTLARDIPVSAEAADSFSQRLSGLMLAIPFVAQVLVAGSCSTVFQHSHIPESRTFFCLC